MDIQISERLDRDQFMQCVDAALKYLEDKGVTAYSKIDVVMNTHQKDSEDVYHIRCTKTNEIVRLLMHYEDGKVRIEEVVVEPNYAVVREMNSEGKKRAIVKTMFAILGGGFLLWVVYLYFQYGWNEVVKMFPFTYVF